MQIIPVQAIPSQTFNMTLGGQSCTINLYQKGATQDSGVFSVQNGALLTTESNLELFSSPLPHAPSQNLYLDLYVNNTLIIGGVICRNATVIVRNTYLGFTGDLAFYDLQGSTDPVYTGLGSRYILAYLAPGDMPSSAVQTLQVAA